jgi:hypothetical protein
MNMRKKEFHPTFSYLDVFLLLLAGLFLSFLVYFFAEKDTVREPAQVEVTVKTVYEKDLLEAIPEAGEELYDQSGNKIGKILSVQVGEGEIKKEAEMTLLIPEGAYREGDVFRVETKDCIREGEIVSVKESRDVTKGEENG